MRLQVATVCVTGMLHCVVLLCAVLGKRFFKILMRIRKTVSEKGVTTSDEERLSLHTRQRLCVHPLTRKTRSAQIQPGHVSVSPIRWELPHSVQKCIGDRVTYDVMPCDYRQPQRQP